MGGGSPLLALAPGHLGRLGGRCSTPMLARVSARLVPSLVLMGSLVLAHCACKRFPKGARASAPPAQGSAARAHRPDSTHPPWPSSRHGGRERLKKRPPPLAPALGRLTRWEGGCAESNVGSVPPPDARASGTGSHGPDRTHPRAVVTRGGTPQGGSRVLTASALRGGEQRMSHLYGGSRWRQVPRPLVLRVNGARWSVWVMCPDPVT